MAVPKYYEMYRSFLKVLMDGNIHSMKEEKQQVIDDFHLVADRRFSTIESDGAEHISKKHNLLKARQEDNIG